MSKVSRVKVQCTAHQPRNIAGYQPLAIRLLPACPLGVKPPTNCESGEPRLCASLRHIRTTVQCSNACLELGLQLPLAHACNLLGCLL